MAITYNSFKQPTQITRNTSTFHFSYGANLERLKETRNGTVTYEIDQVYEEDANGHWRLYLDDIALIKYDDAQQHQIYYMHKDRLGSTLTYTDHNGQVTDRRRYDAFGKPQGATENSPLGSRLENITLSRKGFTDHRHLDEVELIHMNGRAYDYNLGRFLSVDPIIQSPGNSQSLNPYSYIMNNPLAGTDPTGYVGCAASKIERVCDNTISRWGGNGNADAAFYAPKSDNANSGNGAKNQPQESAQGTPTTDIQSAANRSWNPSKTSEIAEKYEGISTDVDVEIAMMESNLNDYGQTAARGGRRGNTTRDPLQPYINARYNRVFEQIRALDPHFSVARPAGRTTRRDLEVLETQLANLRGASIPQLYWPPNMGFQGPIRNTHLRPGQVVDRYGLEGGHFVSPAGTPFGQRSLPGDARNLPYTQYRVLRPIHVREGVVAPAFGQFGGGTQYILPLRVRTLVERGYLERVNQ
ncbi:glycohydrolase toxin TNT-related protein [Chromatiaceae bacterium AAb-1]|nr:glycohydrolase toxin TNT-related protein [Chromatiaceae bacterium AAb-1]